MGPGEQNGKCLFGMGTDLILDVFMDSGVVRGGGGVRERRGVCCWTTSVAMV